MNGYIVALLVLVAWFVSVYLLSRAKWLEAHDMGFMGPLLLWKTKRGRDIIDRLSSMKRFWSVYGVVSLWVCAVSMVLFMVLLLWEATIVPRIERPPAPELMLGIPGINPVIPLGYGILGLVVAIVVHEVSHGVMTRVGGMKVQSLGLAFLVVPVGAFVEPDEKELQATTRRLRSRVFAAGPASNILLALLVLGIFSGVVMSSVEPSEEGALAIGVVQGSPLDAAGVAPSSLIVRVGGVVIQGADDLRSRSAPCPGSNVTVQYFYEGRLRSADVVDGVVVAYVTEGYAAAQAGLRTGMVLVSIDDVPLGNTTVLSQVMSNLRAGQTVNVTVMRFDEAQRVFVVDTSITTITLSDKWEYYNDFFKDENDPSYRGKGYLGAGFLDLGVRVEDASYYARMLANPFEGDRDLDDFSRSWLRLIALPFLDLAPLRPPVTDLYLPSGSFAWMPNTSFWLMANSLYWIFWLNLMVGLTNVLPAVPMDGGYLFRDAVGYALDRVKSGYTKEQKERVAGSISLAFALLVLFLIIWQLVGPAL